ncbi:uncharacterized protein [Dermacentor albipictus]|uniref:uncharacterized protein n=1 Tax=Dermacentor albipictus TaxID=60249 RepID=UPI0038FD10D5
MAATMPVEHDLLYKQSCEGVREAVQKLEGNWAAKFDELKAELREEQEKQVALQAKVDNFVKVEAAQAAQLVRTVAELEAEKERSAELERRLDALETRAAEKVESGQQSVGKNSVSRVDPTGEVGGREPKQAVVSSPPVKRRNYSEAAQRAPSEATLQSQGRQRAQREGQQAQAAVERFARRRVLVIGDSNVGRAEQGVMARVKVDGRVQVEVQAGKGMAEAMTKAREVVGVSTESDSLVIMHSGLNDVLKGRSQDLQRHIETGLRKLREASGRVHVTICTIPEVQGQAYQVERRVVEANRVIRSLSGRLGYSVMEVNRDTYGTGFRSFVQDGIHYSGATGKRIGGRMGRQATAFLGGPRALKEAV